MSFHPISDYIEVEPMYSESPLSSDDKKFVEKARVVSNPTGWKVGSTLIVEGDIIFFRPHGFFELAEHNGIKRYVVRADPEFIFGVETQDVAKQ